MDDLRKALFRALEKSDINMLRAVLKRGVSLAYEEEDNYPPFLQAINGGRKDIDILETLKAAGADPAVQWKRGGDTALHWVIGYETPDVLRWFLAQGLPVDAQNDDGQTPLMRAVKWADWPDVRLPERALGLRDARILLEAGADPNLIDANGETALHVAAGSGLCEALTLLLSFGAAVDAGGHDGGTALHAAAAGGYADAVRLLLAAGADIAAKDGSGDDVLTTAANSDCVDVAKILIAHGADVSADTSAALREAVFFEYDDMLDLLLAAGATCDRSFGEDGYAPLHWAAHEDYAHGVDVLIEHGAGIEAQAIDGETPLLIAVRRQACSAVARLISHGADRAHTDHYGNTALSWAQRRQDARLIELLSQ